VIERRLTALAPVDQLEGPPLMFDVAALAGSIDFSGVQSLALGNPLRQGLVAGQATVRVDAPPRAVAVETAIARVERGVRPTELARRELRMIGASSESDDRQT
jgi:hypothetical protein